MLEGFWIRNYKSIRQVGIGTAFPQFVYIEDETTVFPYPLDTVTLFTGVSGSGRSTMFDVFSFISDSLRHGVDFACLKRGGYDAVYSQGGKGPISFGFHYREGDEAAAATYAISIACSKNKTPFIESELLAYRRGKDSLPIIFLQNGAKSIRYLAPDQRLAGDALTKIEFTDYKNLGLAALESHPKYPVFASLRNLFEHWVLSNFTTDPARGLGLALPKRHDSVRGVSLSGLVRYMLGRYGDQIDPLLSRIASFLPGIVSIGIDRTDTEKPTLFFRTEHFPQPVSISLLSDATVRLFAYFLLMEEDRPAPLIAVEEPENGLDRLHCWHLAQQIVRFNDFPRGSQLFLTTHHPGFADVLHPAQVWLFDRDKDGFTTVERAADSTRLQRAVEENQDLDPRWFSERFEEEL